MCRHRFSLLSGGRAKDTRILMLTPIIPGTEIRFKDFDYGESELRPLGRLPEIFEIDIS